MKKILTIILVSFACVMNAQKPKSTPPAPQKQTTPAEQPKEQAAQQVNPFIDHFLKKYQLATRWNDLVTAKDALYDLIAETGNDSLAYTLAVYYYENRQ